MASLHPYNCQHRCPDGNTDKIPTSKFSLFTAPIKSTGFAKTFDRRPKWYTQFTIQLHWPTSLILSLFAAASVKRNIRASSPRPQVMTKTEQRWRRPNDDASPSKQEN